MNADAKQLVREVDGVLAESGREVKGRVKEVVELLGEVRRKEKARDVAAGTYEQVLDHYSERCRDAVMGAAMLVHCQRFSLDYVTGNMRLVTDLRRLASRLIDDNARAVFSRYIRKAKVGCLNECEHMADLARVRLPYLLRDGKSKLMEDMTDEEVREAVSVCAGGFLLVCSRRRKVTFRNYCTVVPCGVVTQQDETGKLRKFLEIRELRGAERKTQMDCALLDAYCRENNIRFG